MRQGRVIFLISIASFSKTRLKGFIMIRHFSPLCLNATPGSAEARIHKEVKYQGSVIKIPAKTMSSQFHSYTWDFPISTISTRKFSLETSIMSFYPLELSVP